MGGDSNHGGQLARVGSSSNYKMSPNGLLKLGMALYGMLVGG